MFLSLHSPFLSEVNDIFTYLMKQNFVANHQDPWQPGFLEEVPQVTDTGLVVLGGCARGHPPLWVGRLISMQ